MRARFRELRTSTLVHRPAATGSSTAAAAMSLSTSPWTSGPPFDTFAQGINNAGQIVGYLHRQRQHLVTDSCTTAATTTLPSTIPWARRSMVSKSMASMTPAIWSDFIMTAAATAWLPCAGRRARLHYPRSSRGRDQQPGPDRRIVRRHIRRFVRLPVQRRHLQDPWPEEHCRDRHQRCGRNRRIFVIHHWQSGSFGFLDKGGTLSLHQGSLGDGQHVRDGHQ